MKLLIDFFSTITWICILSKWNERLLHSTAIRLKYNIYKYILMYIQKKTDRKKKLRRELKTKENAVLS